MTDFLATIAAEAAAIRAAYEANRSGRVPWSDRWSVGSVARHVANAHHVVARVVAERPTASFDLFDELVTLPKDDPGFVAWSAAGTDALCAALGDAPADDPCWTVHPEADTVAFWGRHMAHETLLHRWDAEAGAGLVPGPIEPALAADGVDEYLLLYVPVGRRMYRSPAGPPVRIACDDTGDEWFLELGGDGAVAIGRDPIPVDATLHGPAAGVLLALWRRQEPDAVGVGLDGDPAFLERRDDLLPPL